MKKDYTEVFGIKELDDLFNNLKLSQQRGIIISTFRQASKPLIEQAKTNLIARTKTSANSRLAKSLGVEPVNRLPILKIGARKGKNYGGYQAHLLERGTVERMFKHKKSGKEHFTGKVSATNFFQDAVDGSTKQVIDSVEEQMIISFKKFVQKANAKNKY